MNVELDEIRSFTVLATTLHFGKASEQLHISQPALSKKIQRLEEKLGGQLLRRTRRRVSLTEPGRVFLLKSKKLLDETDSAVSATQAAVEGKAGRLRIGFGIASVSGILPRTILQFRKSYPGVELQMRDMSTPAQVSALLEGAIDVGILRLPVAHPELVSRPLFEEKLVLAAPRSIHFHRKNGLGSFRRHPFIFLPRSTSETFHDHAMSLCRRAGFMPDIVQNASEIFTILNLVRAGLGVSLVPSSAIRMNVPGVRFHDLRMAEAKWRIGIVWKRNSEKGSLVSRIVSVIMKEAGVSGQKT